MNNAITEIKSTLEGTNSRITEAKDRISEVEDRMLEINEASNLDWRLVSYMILCIFQSHSPKSRFDTQYWILGAGALRRHRGMVQGGRREEGSGWGTRVYLWWIHVDIWQNQYNIVKLIT